MKKNPGQRILYVGTLPPHTGGSAISCAQILLGIVETGFSVTAICPITIASMGEVDRFAAEHPELRVLRYPITEFINEPASPQQRKEEEDQVGGLFRETVGRFRPDLVVVGRESFSRCVPALAREYDLPVMQWVRGGHCSNYAYWRGTQDGRDIIEEFRKAKLVITVADHLTRDLERLGVVDVKTIPNAIDLSMFCPRPEQESLRTELGIAGGQKIILVPGNLIHRKRPFDVIESAARAVRKDPSLTYVMVGADRLDGKVQQACKELGVSDSFRFAGWVEFERMPDFYNLADIVVMASEGEGLARAYLEAMACERTLVASNIAASREVVDDGENGLLFPLGDCDELAERILMIASDPQLRSRLGRNARRSVANRSLVEARQMYLAEIEAVFSG